MLKIRAVVLDYYLAKPIDEYCGRDQTLYEAEPVVRIFGSTVDGTKSCVHVHGVYPYIYVPYKGGENPERDALLLGAALDEALKTSARQKNFKFIHGVSLVSGIPLYGYHSNYRQFFKICFYNPYHIRLASELLLNGAILGQKLQPHEAHIPFVLQFMMDYNIYGMSFVTFSKIKYRRDPEKPESLFGINEEDIFSEKVEKLTCSRLEADARASDIVNRNCMKGTDLNPGLRAIRDEERSRMRRLSGVASATPQSPPRAPASAQSFAESIYKERLLKKLRGISVEEPESPISSDEPKLSYPAEVPEDRKVSAASEADDAAELSLVEGDLPDVRNLIDENVLTQITTGRKEGSESESEEERIEADSVLGRWRGEGEGEEAEEEEEEEEELEDVAGEDSAQPPELEPEESPLLRPSNRDEPRKSSSETESEFWKNMADKIFQLDGAQDSSSESDRDSSGNGKGPDFCCFGKDDKNRTIAADVPAHPEPGFNWSGNIFSFLGDDGECPTPVGFFQTPQNLWSDYSPKMDSWSSQTSVFGKTEVGLSDYFSTKSEGGTCDFSAALSDEINSNELCANFFCPVEDERLAESGSPRAAADVSASPAVVAGADSHSSVPVGEIVGRTSGPEARRSSPEKDVLQSKMVVVPKRNRRKEASDSAEEKLTSVLKTFTGPEKAESLLDREKKVASLTLKQYIKDCSEIVNVDFKNLCNRDMVVIEYKTVQGRSGQNKFLIKPLDKFLERWNIAEKKVNSKRSKDLDNGMKGGLPSSSKKNFISHTLKENSESSGVALVKSVETVTANRNVPNVSGGKSYKVNENVISRGNIRMKLIKSRRINSESNTFKKTKAAVLSLEKDEKTAAAGPEKKPKVSEGASKKMKAKFRDEFPQKWEGQKESKSLSALDTKLISQINSSFEEYFKSLVKLNQRQGRNENFDPGTRRREEKRKKKESISSAVPQERIAGAGFSRSQWDPVEVVSRFLSTFSRMYPASEAPSLSITVGLGNGTGSAPAPIQLNFQPAMPLPGIESEKKFWEKVKIKNVDGAADSSSEESVDTAETKSRVGGSAGGRKRSKRESFYKPLKVVLRDGRGRRKKRKISGGEEENCDRNSIREDYLNVCRLSEKLSQDTGQLKSSVPDDEDGPSKIANISIQMVENYKSNSPAGGSRDSDPEADFIYDSDPKDASDDSIPVTKSSFKRKNRRKIAVDDFPEKSRAVALPEIEKNTGKPGQTEASGRPQNPENPTDGVSAVVTVARDQSGKDADREKSPPPEESGPGNEERRNFSKSGCSFGVDELPSAVVGTPPADSISSGCSENPEARTFVFCKSSSSGSRSNETFSDRFLAGLENLTTEKPDEFLDGSESSVHELLESVESASSESKAGKAAGGSVESELLASRILLPKLKPPTKNQVSEFLRKEGIFNGLGKRPFYGDAGDLTEALEAGPRIIKIQSESVAGLRTHKCLAEVKGIEDRRNFLLGTENKNWENIRYLYASENRTTIMPLNKPPSFSDAVEWSRIKNKPKTKENNKIKLARPVRQESDSDAETETDLSMSLSLSLPAGAGGSGSGTAALEGPPKSPLEETRTGLVFPEGILTLQSRKEGVTTEVEGMKKVWETKKLETVTEGKEMATSSGNASRGSDKSFSGNRRRSSDNSFQIRGVTCEDTLGFPDSVENLQNLNPNHSHQHMSLLVVEVHAQTRKDLRPDPRIDPVRALFYAIDFDGPGRGVETGAVVVGDAFLLGTEFPSAAVHYVPSEAALIEKTVELVKTWDPDVLAGYEIETSSWGYLVQRGFVLEKNLFAELGRVLPVRGAARSSASDFAIDSDDGFDDVPKSLKNMRISGRIVLDVWRVLRHEVALTSYTFENVAYHLSHERHPLLSHETLSYYWEHPTRRFRHLVADHYATRVLGVIRLLDQLDFVNRTSELSRLFGIQFYEVLSRGSQYRVESMMLRSAKPLNYIPVSPSIAQRAAMRAPASLPLIMEPESVFYSDPLVVLDFQSLYPSIMIGYNYCFSTCLGRIEKLGGREPFEFGCTQLQISPEELKRLENDITISPAGVGFVKPTVRKGVLPAMLEAILDTRLTVKKSMKANKQNKVLQKLLFARQLGLKLIANVTYGYTAANFSGRMPCIEVGDSVVSKGRETLERAIKLVKATPEWGAQVVYGDTDSIFVLTPGKSIEESFRIGEEIAKAVTQDNPKPVKLKLEKVYLPSILQTKKRYVGYMYESPDQKQPVFEAKGIETVRRDGCPAAGKILRKALQILFDTRDVSLVKKYAVRQFAKLFQGKVNLQDLIIAKEYRGRKGYRPGACVPALELAKRWTARDRRAEPRVKERVPYVIANGPPGAPLIRLVRSPKDFLADPSLRPNATYYITKAVVPPLQRCFSLLGADVASWYSEMPRKFHKTAKSVGGGGLEAQKKTTISQYFSAVECVVCSKVTNDLVCPECEARPQEVAVRLGEKIRRSERSHAGVLKICQSCCGRQTELDCLSLDCPVLFRRIQAAREADRARALRELLERRL